SRPSATSSPGGRQGAARERGSAVVRTRLLRSRPSRRMRGCVPEPAGLLLLRAAGAHLAEEPRSSRFPGDSPQNLLSPPLHCRPQVLRVRPPPPCRPPPP